MGACSTKFEYDDKSIEVDIKESGIEIDLLFLASDRDKLTKKQRKVLDTNIKNFVRQKIKQPELVRQTAVQINEQTN